MGKRRSDGVIDYYDRIRLLFFFCVHGLLNIPNNNNKVDAFDARKELLLLAKAAAAWARISNWNLSRAKAICVTAGSVYVRNVGVGICMSIAKLLDFLCPFKELLLVCTQKQTLLAPAPSSLIMNLQRISPTQAKAFSIVNPFNVQVSVPIPILFSSRPTE